MDIRNEITTLRGNGQTWNQIAKTFKERGYKTRRGSRYTAAYLSQVLSKGSTRDTSQQTKSQDAVRTDLQTSPIARLFVKSVLTVRDLTVDQRALIIDSFYSEYSN